MPDRAVQRSRQSYADTRQTGSAITAPPGFGFSFGQIRIYSDGRDHTLPGAAQTDSFGERTPSSAPAHRPMDKDCDCKGAAGECHCGDSELKRPAGHGARRPWHSCGLLDQDALTGVGIKPMELPLHDIRQPRDDDATIVCDGRGGYRVLILDGWAGAPCGLEGCIRACTRNPTSPTGRCDGPTAVKTKLTGPKFLWVETGMIIFLKAP